MKNNEAIMILESIQPSCGEKYSFSESEIYEAIDMAIEALEKQMPKKAELDVYDELICPVCGSDVEWKRYCEECGQRIDTGDES